MRLKEPTLVEDYEHVFSGDDAFDHKDPDFFTKYAEAQVSGDWSQLKTKRGQKPVIWKMQHLDGVVRARIKDMVYNAIRNGATRIPHAVLYHACRFALKGVVGLVNQRNEPVAMIPTFPETDEWGRATSVTDAFMSLLGCIETDNEITNDSLMQELGAVAIENLTLSKK